MQEGWGQNQDTKIGTGVSEAGVKGAERNEESLNLSTRKHSLKELCPGQEMRRAPMDRTVRSCAMVRLTVTCHMHGLHKRGKLSTLTSESQMASLFNLLFFNTEKGK